MTGTYRTVAGEGDAEIEVRDSTFIGHVAPVEGVETAEAFVAAVREEYADATHNVPAYRVRVGERQPGGGGPAGDRGAGSAIDRGDGPAGDRGAGGGAFLREYHSDDDEPSGSAGKPALNVLVQQDIENVVAVVTRYYGGTNLGVGGLSRAYGRAVKLAVDAAGVIDAIPHEVVTLVVEYDDSGTARGIVESRGYEFEADYGESVRFDVRVPLTDASEFRDRLRSATSGRVEFEA